MISKYTLRLLKLTVWVSSLLWLTEMKWNKKKQRFVTKSTLRVPIMLAYQTQARFVAITYFGSFLFLTDNEILSWDFRVGIAWLFQCLVTTPFWVWNMKNRGFWGLLFNQFLSYNRNLAKFHDKPIFVKKDGLEAILTVLLLGTLFITPLAPFLAFLILEYRNPAIIRTPIHVAAFIAGTSITTANIGASLVLALFLVFDVVLFITSFVWALAYIHCTYNWLKRHCWTLAIYNNKQKRQEMRLLYRQMQIVYKWPYERVVRTTEFALSIIASNLYIAFGIFFFIRSLDSSDHTFFAAQGLVTLGMCIGIEMLLDSGNGVTEKSTLYVTSFNKEVPNAMKYEICYMRSCYPFKWFLGSMLIIDHQTFVWIMSEFTMSMVLSLLQAF